MNSMRTWEWHKGNEGIQLAIFELRFKIEKKNEMKENLI